MVVLSSVPMATTPLLRTRSLSLPAVSTLNVLEAGNLTAVSVSPV